MSCKLGRLDIVDTLMKQGVHPGSNVWEEASALYSATVNGHDGLVDMLYTQYPGLDCFMDMDIDILYCPIKAHHVMLQ